MKFHFHNLHYGAIFCNTTLKSKCDLYCKFISTIDENVGSQIHNTSGNIVENLIPHLECLIVNINNVLEKEIVLGTYVNILQEGNYSMLLEWHNVGRNEKLVEDFWHWIKSTLMWKDNHVGANCDTIWEEEIMLSENNKFYWRDFVQI